MTPSGGDRRFWESTRGRIIMLLRGGGQTVAELAATLNLTESAVRTQLDRLARDGLVTPSGSRPGPRKPTIVYDLTPQAERYFPKVYGPLLRHALDELADRLPPAAREEVARSIGHRLAAEHRSAVQGDDPRERVTQVLGLLNEWGGFCRPEEEDDRVVLRCPDCPLALLVDGHPEVCLLMETVLADLLNLPVEHHCEAKPVPKCQFEIRLDGPT